MKNARSLIGFYKTAVPMDTQRKLVSLANFFGANRLLSPFYAPLCGFRLIGNENCGVAPLRCSIVSDRVTANYLASVLYDHAPLVTEAGRVHEGEFARAQSGFESDMSVYVVPISYKNLFPKGLFFSLSGVVHFSLDLKMDNETLLKKLQPKRRSNIRKIKVCSDYSYEISHDLEDFNYFCSFIILTLMSGMGFPLRL